MAKVSSLCVYCGSSNRVSPELLGHAYDLGRGLAEAGIGLVYGGGRVGMMGRVADGVLSLGGTVTGIIPTNLYDRELAHRGVSDLVVVDTMHERKRQMAERADAFAILPGGFGTLDEMFEIVTWRILGLHDKPVLIVNDQGYWDPLLALLDRIYDEGFASPGTRRHYTIVAAIGDILPNLASLPGATHPTEGVRI